MAVNPKSNMLGSQKTLIKNINKCNKILFTALNKGNIRFSYWSNSSQSRSSLCKCPKAESILKNRTNKNGFIQKIKKNSQPTQNKIN